MNRPKLQKQNFHGTAWHGAAWHVAAWLAVVALSAAVTLAQDNGSGSRGDSQIEMDVVHALDAAPQLKNDLITAATIQGEVTISGTVSTGEDRKLAESIVARVEGVGKVHNNLKVGDPKAAEDAQNLQQPVPADDPAFDHSQGNQQANGNVQPQPQPDYAQPQPGNQQGQYPPQSQYPPQGQYPAQGQYPDQGQQPYPGQQQPYYSQQQPQQPPPPAYRPAPGPVAIPAGTLLALRTSEPVESKRAKEGEPIQFVLINDVTAGGYVAIPRGATVHGVLSEVKNPDRGSLGGSPVIALRLTSLDLGGQSYALDSDEFKVKGPNKAGHTVGNALGGALLGAMIGGMAGGGTGAAIGAGAGAGVGTAASAASSGPGVWIPAEARVDFHLNTPVTVTPVNAQEAARLAQGLYPGGPSLYRRGPGYYGRPGYYGSPYGYPPVYYRPYYMVGGYYSWR